MTTAQGAPAVVVVAPPHAGGIRQSAEDMAAALGQLGIAASVAARPDPGRPAHVHYGNADRSVLGFLARRRGDVVSIHDVVPRDRLLRRLLPPVVAPVLARHHLVVHSRHAAGLLAAALPGAAADVLPLLLSVPVSPGPSPLGPPDGRLTAVLAGRLRATKGVAELVEAVAGRPGMRLVLVGRAVDRSAEALVRARPANVDHLDQPDQAAFFAALAAADVLVTWRSDSVGETSGPVVQAHLYGTPVAGLELGSLPEYCGPGDVLVPSGTAPAGLVDALLAAPPDRIPTGDARREGPVALAGRYVELYRRIGMLPEAP